MCHFALLSVYRYFVPNGRTLVYALSLNSVLHFLIKFLLFRETLSHSSSIRKVCILSQHGAYGTDLNPLNPRGAWATLSCQVLASISILLSIHNCFARRISFLRLQIVIFVSRTLFSSVLVFRASCSCSRDCYRCDVGESICGRHMVVSGPSITLGTSMIYQPTHARIDFLVGLPY